VRLAFVTIVLTAVLAPAALAQTATTPQPAPGSPFSSPVQDLVGQPTTQTTVATTKRAGETDSGRGTLLLLSIAALVMIAGVGAFIWYEGAKSKTSEAKRRRQRMRAGRPAASAASLSAGSRTGPPPPPRKRGSKSKRKKR
jgi:uncharacterized protein HemX